eukprot:355198_1
MLKSQLHKFSNIWQRNSIYISRCSVSKLSKSIESNKYDIRQCREIRIRCISEIGWFNNDILLSNISKSGGMNTSQYEIKWDPSNAAGSCSLIEITNIDNSTNKFLLDTGWNSEYIDSCFKREGIDKMLENKQIDFIFSSHEHMDHLWGIQAVLKYDSLITLLIPNTYQPETMKYLNDIHKGKRIHLETDTMYSLFDGCAAKVFDVKTVLNISGEASLYFNIKEKGIVCVTGCCHQGIESLTDFASNYIEDGENMYGVYGGLHIVPFSDELNETQTQIIQNMKQYNFKKIACNHCTGLVAVRKMKELGYPVVQGSAQFGSKSDLYIGNGDQVIF